MKGSVYRPGLGKAPALRGGGAASQVGQVRSLDSGVSQAQRSEGSLLAGAGTTEGSLGLRIQFWEAGLVSQTPPQRNAMDGVRRVGLVVAFSVSVSPGRVPPSRELGKGCPCVPPPGTNTSV